MTATSALLIIVAIFIIINAGNLANVMTGKATIGQTPTTPTGGVTGTNSTSQTGPRPPTGTK